MAKRNLSNNDLIDAGFSQSQVIVLHDYFQEKVTPDYRKLATTDQLDALGDKLDAKIEAQSDKLRLEMEKNNAELRLDNLKLELKKAKRITEMHRRWTIGTIIAMTAVIVAFMAYFNQH